MKLNAKEIAAEVMRIVDTRSVHTSREQWTEVEAQVAELLEDWSATKGSEK